MNPIIRRELLELLRTRKAAAAQVGLAVACSLLVLLPLADGGISDLSGARSLQVLRVFGYGLLAGILFIVPAFPATALVREKIRGTLALLLNSPMSPAGIYAGKLGAVLGFTALLLLMTLPAAAACYALGGSSSQSGVGKLYVVLSVAAVQLATLGLLVSIRTNSIDMALRTTYALVLFLCSVPLIPHWLMRGDTGPIADAAGWLRCFSPVPAVMEILGHGGVGSRGMEIGGGAVPRYILLAVLMSIGCALRTIWRLKRAPLDKRARRE